MKNFQRRICERILIDLSDYTEDFLRISLCGIVASTQIQKYDIHFNAFLEEFFILNMKMKILPKKGNANIFQINSLLTST
jgi:hypothetical protein